MYIQLTGFDIYKITFDFLVVTFDFSKGITRKNVIEYITLHSIFYIL